MERPHPTYNARDLHEERMESAGFNTRLAVGITRAFGSIFAFYALIAWMLIWMALASAGIWLFAADHYTFSFLLFLSNLVQLWALPVLAVGQRVLGKHQELQSEEQYKATMNSYHDIEQVMAHLAAQDEELARQTALLLQLAQPRIVKSKQSLTSPKE